MFFEIAKEKNEVFGSYCTLPNGLTFSSDLGWQVVENYNCHVLYKGYNLEALSLDNLIDQCIHDPTPRYRGNFFLIISTAEKTIITHNIDRSSPLTLKDQSVSNLYVDETHSIWADRFLTINKNFEVTETFFQPFISNVIELDYEASIKKVDKILSETFEKFLSTNIKPIKVFLSGGIDTLTGFAYLDKFTKNYEIVDYQYRKITHFYKHNYLSQLQKFWAYNQMHSWGEVPTVLLSGTHGDETFLRGPTTANMMCIHHGIDLIHELESQPNCYHYKYFQREKNRKLIIEQCKNVELKNKLKNRETVMYEILNVLVNDHQHWHIDETIFFTPLKNLEISTVLLNLPKKHFLDQVLNAGFQKQLIENIDPNKLKLLNKFKNHQE